jgi:hypothetical protein
MMKYPRSTSIAIAASFILAASCATASKPNPPAVSEDAIVDAGIRYFAEGQLRKAENVWSTIADPAKRSLYLSFSRAYSAFDKAVAKAEKALSSSGPEAAIAAVKESGASPSPPEPIEASAADPLGARARLERVGSEAALALVARASDTERAADSDLENARSVKGKDQATSAGKAQGGFEEAVRLYHGAEGWAPDAEEDARKADAKAHAAEELRKRLVKESMLSFPDRMGQVFARSPASSERLGDKELLAFNAETAAIIAGSLADFEKIAAENPDILDAATLDRLRGSARDLSVRFARIESAIKAVKDRGKPVMPLIIGIFNPQPGDPQRSRPASFTGTLAGGSDWWWGIADIPKGLAQDLVITMSDTRPVRVFAAGQGIGSGSRRTTSDLVNPLFKVGNSWPVLNAGARLENGVFHIEIGPGQSDGYSGEAVVYKSFMTRTR